MSERCGGAGDRPNPNTLYSFLGAEMLFFERTESIVWLDTVAFLTPQSPLTDELHDRCIGTESDRREDGDRA